MGKVRWMRIWLGILGVVLTASFGVGWPHPALAANGNFVLSPGKVEVTVAAGQSVTRQLSIINNLGQDSTFIFSAEDFEGNTDSDQELVELLGEAKGQNSLKNYLSFATDSVNIPSAGEYLLDVTITIPANVPAGALYGAVLVNTDSGPNQANIQVNSRLASLFFVKVEGEVFEEGHLSNFQADRSLYLNSPIKLSFDYLNTGDVYLNPYGIITVSNIFGKTVSRTEIKPYFVLPDATRHTGITLVNDKMFGPYRVKMQLNRGYDNIIDEQAIWLWVLPWQGVAVTILVLGAIIYLVIKAVKHRPQPHKIFKTNKSKQ